MHRTVILGIITSLLLVIGAPLGVLAQAPPAPIIRDIAIRGVERAPAQAREQLQQAITSQVGQPFSQETAEADVSRIMELGWFFRADYRTEPMADGVRLIFNIVENPVINAIDFIGNAVLTDEALMQVVKTKPGEVLNSGQAVQDARAIRQAYAAEGYTFTEIVDIVPTPEGTLEFYIFEPKIDEIRIKGNTKTREYVIRRELVIKPGDIYNEKLIRDSFANLDRLGIFQDVGMKPEPGLEPGTLTLVFEVTERRTGQAAFGVGSSNIEGLIGFIDVSDINFRGTGQSVSARVQFGADSSYQLSYTNPWIDAKRTRMTINVYDRSILREAVRAADETFTYNEQRKGGNIAFSRPVFPNTRAAITFRADDIAATPEGTNPVPDDLREGAQVRSITLSTVRDTRKNFLNPSGGSYASAAVEYAGFGGANFTKLTGEARRYWIVRGVPETTVAVGKKTPQPWVLASRLTVGAISGAPPFLDQFLVGGADTLRGFTEDRFPGERMALLNTELRVPVTDALQLIAFVDAGDAWMGQFAESYGDASFDLHYGYGVGVRVQTPIGPLRLDYGRNDEGGNEFHFGVGQTF